MNLLAVAEDTLVVGAHMESGGDPSDPTDDSAAASGAAYVFVRDATTGAWSRQAYLKAFNLDPFDSFGWVVAISGGLVVVSGFDEASDDPSNPNDPLLRQVLLLMMLLLRAVMLIYR